MPRIPLARYHLAQYAPFTSPMCRSKARSSLKHLKESTRGGGDLHSFLPFMEVAPRPAGRISRLTGMYVHQRLEVYGPKGRTGHKGQSETGFKDLVAPGGMCLFPGADWCL